MGKVRVVTDSSCDLTPEECEEFGIHIIPLIVRIGKEEFLEGELEIDEYWERVEKLREQGGFPQTSQPSIGTFQKVFAKIIERGEEVVCITITSKHSGTFNTALAAAQDFGEKVSIFDSWSTSLGLGFQVIKAAKAALNGANRDKILELLEDIRTRTHLLAFLNSLEFIRKGGRVDKLVPIFDRITKFFNIKVIIGFVKGELKLRGQARTINKALRQLEQGVMSWGLLDRLGVIHTRAAELAERFAKSLKEKTGFPGSILIRETGAVLSAHAGPGVVGVVGVKHE